MSRGGAAPFFEHIPRREFYPTLEKFNYTAHEYYRYHNAYLTRYDEGELVRIFAETAQRHDDKEMGDFIIGFRCESVALMGYIQKELSTGGKVYRLLEQAHDRLAKTNKRAAKLLERKFIGYIYSDTTATVRFFFETPSKKGKKA